MTKKQKKVLIRIIAAVVLMVAITIVDAKVSLPVWALAIMYLVPYLVIGYDILKKAGKGILNRQVFDENFLMAVATVGAMLLGEFKEGVAVMLFYQIGELFQSVAVGRSRKNIAALMDIRPDYANVLDDGVVTKVDPDEVEPGTIIVVNPGEKVPIDGVIVEGSTALNTSALTGESVPRSAECGDEIISGCINMSGVIKIRTTKEFGESTVSGGKFQYEEVPFGKFYHQICEILYTCSLLQCTGTGSAPATCQDDGWECTAVGRLGDSCTDVSGNQLSLRIGYFHST